jgi:hypothetical protein
MQAGAGDNQHITGVHRGLEDDAFTKVAQRVMAMQHAFRRLHVDAVGARNDDEATVTGLDIA